VHSTSPQRASLPMPQRTKKDRILSNFTKTEDIQIKSEALRCPSMSNRTPWERNPRLCHPRACNFFDFSLPGSPDEKKPLSPEGRAENSPGRSPGPGVSTYSFDEAYVIPPREAGLDVALISTCEKCGLATRFGRGPGLFQCLKETIAPGKDVVLANLMAQAKHTPSAFFRLHLQSLL
jgi:hypothetical protein